MSRLLLLVAVLTIAAGGPAAAQQQLHGWFIALRSCEAYQSKNQLTNPGDVQVTNHKAYDIIGINKAGGEWYQICIPGAPVAEARWVSTACGVHVTAAGPMPQPRGSSTTFEPPAGSEATDLLLVLSWEPAFCKMKPAKTECKQLNEGLLPITENQLSLHGLWPQPNGTFYCGVPAAVKALDKPDSWDRLPAPELTPGTAERLAVAMPGTASHLERHEWIKHGSCFFGGAKGEAYFSAALKGEAYFSAALKAMDTVNQAGIATLFAAHVGAELGSADIRVAFDQAFGAGAGDRVQMHCKGDQGRLLIQDITISLKGKLTKTADLATLIRAGDPQSAGCIRGVVDPTGLQ